jgi:hypothetical protein
LYRSRYRIEVIDMSDTADAGVSRRVAWPDRPQAAHLLVAITDPARPFDAIVVGEYERAFTGQQLDQLAPILRRHQVALWLPETYGPVDLDNPRQLALLDLLGVRSHREMVAPQGGLAALAAPCRCRAPRASPATERGHTYPMALGTGGSTTPSP